MRRMKTQQSASRIRVNESGGLLLVEDGVSSVGSPTDDVGMGVGVSI
jgi:hypothetical protein